MRRIENVEKTMWNSAAARQRLLLLRRVYAQRACEELGLPSIYTRFYDRQGCIFIHIPKCAGTSVAHALYGKPPWHFSISDALFINTLKFCRPDYFSFATIRDPYARLYSIYRYAQIDQQKFWLSPLKPIASMQFDEFVNGLTPAIVAGFPFLRTQTSYISCVTTRAVDAVVKVEEFPSALAPVFDRYGIGLTDLPHLNATPATEKLDNAYDRRLRTKVEALYRADFVGFNY